MEYCAHGTIEEASKQGLPEVVIRRYTKGILTAVDFLHEHNIVHRDIKGRSHIPTSSCHWVHTIIVASTGRWIAKMTG